MDIVKEVARVVSSTILCDHGTRRDQCTSSVYILRLFALTSLAPLVLIICMSSVANSGRTARGLCSQHHVNPFVP